MSRLVDYSWYGLDPGGCITTDDIGEAKLDVDGCIFIYALRDSKQLVRRGCRKDAAISGNVSCSVQGTSVYNNACASEVIVQTPSAEIQLQGTWLAVTYLPSLELSLVQIFEGQARVLPVTDLEERKLASEDQAIVVERGNFVFTVPDTRLPEVGVLAGLESRQAHLLAELGAFEEPEFFVSELRRRADEPNLVPWLSRMAERAEIDHISHTPSLVPTETATAPPTTTPTSTPTPIPTTPEESSGDYVYIVRDGVLIQMDASTLQYTGVSDSGWENATLMPGAKRAPPLPVVD